jgi:uncharacterized protein YyaL (SSP411 family)
LLDAYAFILAGVIQLYETTLDPSHLDFALALAQTMLRKFYDREHGGFWQSPPDTAHLILRVKEDYDGAEPSGNSVAVLALLKLAAITGQAQFRQAAEQTLRLFAARLHHMPQALPHMLSALDYCLEEPTRVVIAGHLASLPTRALLRAVHGVYHPDIAILGNTGAAEPFAKTLPAKAGLPLAYLCSGTACKPPVSDPAKLKAMLE